MQRRTERSSSAREADVDGLALATGDELALPDAAIAHSGGRRVEVETAAHALVVGALQVGHDPGGVLRGEGRLRRAAPIEPAAPPAVPHRLERVDAQRVRE